VGGTVHVIVRVEYALLIRLQFPFYPLLDSALLPCVDVSLSTTAAAAAVVVFGDCCGKCVAAGTGLRRGDVADAAAAIAPAAAFSLFALVEVLRARDCKETTTTNNC